MVRLLGGMRAKKYYLTAALFAAAAGAACRRTPPQRPLPEGHWERRLDKGRVVIREYVDTKYQPLTTIIVADESAKAAVETLFQAAFPDLMGPYEQENFNGTLNFSVGLAVDTQIVTLKQYGDSLQGVSLYARREFAQAQADLRGHDAVVYRYFSPKDFFTPGPRR